VNPAPQPPLPPGTTAEHTLDWLRSAIVARELRPGQKVLQEDIARELGVSIGPVREALRTLEQEGQLTYRPRRGYFVTQLRVEDLREIYELRQILEARAMRAALPAHDAESIAGVALAARECTAAAEAGDVARELEANRRFHFALLEARGQQHTLRLIRLGRFITTRRASGAQRTPRTTGSSRRCAPATTIGSCASWTIIASGRF
jgi:DNA-binding GntR family transcriptional regulator